MSEQIELRSLKDNDYNGNESDTEYHEIRNDRLLGETPPSPQTPTKLMKQYDFFTQFDVKSKQKAAKKKKAKKKDPSNLMDIISTELALLQAPLVKNVITKIEYTEEHASYLVKTPKFQKVFQKNKPWCGDAENGWRNKDTSLRPVFPRVIENALAKDKSISVQYVEPVMFDDILSEYQQYETKQSPKFLEISIKDIIFSHHHDFSLEKLLCIKLVDYYKQYSDIQNEMKVIIKNIEINKRTRDNLKKQLLNIGSTTKDDLRFDETVLNYTKKILQYKDKYYQLLKPEKESRHNIISLWADIETVRQKSGSINTAYVLEFSHTVLDNDEYEKEFIDVFETEFSDMLDRLEYEYVIKYLEYKKLKQTYKGGDGDKKRLHKPKLHIDQEKLKDEVERIVSTIVTKEKTKISLIEDKRLTKSLVSNKTKIYTYHFKIYVDSVFVCESEIINTNFMFNWIDFNDTLSIQILPNNEIITIFLCENNIKVASVIINLSEVRVNSSNAHFHTELLRYNNKIEPTAVLVGSGFEIKEVVAKIKVRLKSSNMFNGPLFTTAKVNIKVGWSDKLNNDQCNSIERSLVIGRQLKRLMNGYDEPHVGVLIDIIEKIYHRNIDSDSTIQNALRNVCNSKVYTNWLFKIDANSDEMTRLKLLHLRSTGGFDEVVDKTIPIFPSQISTEQLTCLQKNEENYLDLQILENKSEVDPIDVQRFASVKYVEKLNEKLQKCLSECLLRKTYKDVVRDFKDLSLRALFSNQSNFELETTSSIAKQKLLTECLTKEHEISVVVLGAFNLLDRSTAIISEDLEDNDSIAGFKLRPLRPFVKVTYHGISAQTSTAKGCHPTWNSTLKIKTKLFPMSTIHVDVYDECKVDVSESYSEEMASSLGKVVHYRYYNKWLGTVQIPLYSLLGLGTLRGTFKITSPPLIFGYDAMEPKEPVSVISEVTQLMKKESSFLTLHISTDLCHLGGFQGYTQPVPNSENDIIIKHLNTFLSEYLNEFPSRNISLTYIDSFGRNKCVSEFLQPVPLPHTEWFAKNPKMLESALSKSSGRSRSSSSKSSRRKLSMTTNGEDKESESSVPDNLKSSEARGDPLTKLIDTAARYVALIPAYEVSQCHVITLSGLELLKVLHGSHLDHTLLLASYFLHLGVRCWVVTGSALPRGLSSYVLVKYKQKNRVALLSDTQKNRGFLVRGDGQQFTWSVFDAVSGERFEVRDASCPLKTVSYVFDSENIWVNIQTSQDCESVSFDFSKSSDWQPVFENPPFVMRSPPVSVQGLYSAPPDVEQLRATLENKIKCKVQKWRSHMKTIWNRYCSSLLRELLPHWEYWAFNPTEPRPLLGQRLKQLMITYKMFGFPLNVPYTNAKGVVASVKSTGIHLTDDPAVEFGLAVELYPYPNNVISVWVFLASINRI